MILATLTIGMIMLSMAFGVYSYRSSLVKIQDMLLDIMILVICQENIIN